MFKKFVSLSIVFIMLLSVMMVGIVSSHALETGVSGDCTWSFNNMTGVFTLNGNGYMDDYETSSEDTRPWKDYISDMTSLKINNGVKNIGKNAFSGCNGLTGDLIIPEGVETIGEYAFCECSGFDGELVIPSTVTSIGADAFYMCERFRGDLVIPDSVINIDDYAFFNWGVVQRYIYEDASPKLILGNSIKTIGECAFESCNFTGTLVIPSSLDNIADNPGFYSSTDMDINCNGSEIVRSYCEGIGYVKYSNSDVYTLKKYVIYQAKNTKGETVSLERLEKSLEVEYPFITTDKVIVERDNDNDDLVYRYNEPKTVNSHEVSAQYIITNNSELIDGDKLGGYQVVDNPWEANAVLYTYTVPDNIWYAEDLDGNPLVSIAHNMDGGVYTSEESLQNSIDKIKVFYYTDGSCVYSESVDLNNIKDSQVACYKETSRDSVTHVYNVLNHYLKLDYSRNLVASISSSRSENEERDAFFINKKFMDNLYRDRIIEECGESLSFAEWADRDSNSWYALSIMVSKDGENWYKLYPMTGVKATVVGGDTYMLESRIRKFVDESVPNLGSKYWMLTEADPGYPLNGKPLATGTITWYDYGDDFAGFEGTPTAADLYNAYINAPSEYKTDSINARTGAFVLNVPSNSDESEITQSGNTGSSIVTLDYNTANLRVTVPTVLPVSVDSDNNVTVANNAKIINNSIGQVDVTNAVLSGNNSWTLSEFDTDFKNVPVGTKQYGFKLQGYNVPVSGNAYNNQFGTIAGNASLDLSYDANVAIQSEATKDAEIGNIVFTVAWHK